jgi:hypothetical protein
LLPQKPFDPNRRRPQLDYQRFLTAVLFAQFLLPAHRCFLFELLGKKQQCFLMIVKMHRHCGITFKMVGTSNREESGFSIRVSWKYNLLMRCFSISSILTGNCYHSGYLAASLAQIAGIELSVENPEPLSSFTPSPVAVGISINGTQPNRLLVSPANVDPHRTYHGFASLLRSATQRLNRATSLQQVRYELLDALRAVPEMDYNAIAGVVGQLFITSERSLVIKSIERTFDELFDAPVLVEGLS